MPWLALATSLALGVVAALLALGLDGPGAAAPSAVTATPAPLASGPAAAASEAPAEAARYGAGPAPTREAEDLQVAPPADPAIEATPTPAVIVVASSQTAEDRADAELARQARAGASARGGTRPAEPTPTPTPRTEIVKHRVGDGDNVAALAAKYGISAETITKANALTDPEHLTPGQELVILPFSGLLHTVQEGDTVTDLATQYGVIPEDIAAANKLADVDALQIGQQLIVPEAPLGARTAAPAVPQPLQKPLTPVQYTIAAGDTLSGIADKFGIAMKSLQWANPDIGDIQSLKVGQEMTIPPTDGVLHRVAAGDTLYGVAATYGASAAEIARVNSLKDPYYLTIGSVVVVPGGAPPAPVAAAPAPAAPKPAPAPAAPKPAAPAAPKPAAPAPAVAAAPASSGAGPAAANIALRYVGYPYIWGGSAPPGFDCSGLTYYAYRQAGRWIPRDLWGQLGSGPRITRANLQVGDLVFFENTYTAGLSHVGIYIGGGRFVHASSERTGVITSALSDAYWGARYVGASRP